jgi:glycerophosphoryl diester phosphodiesterase
MSPDAPDLIAHRGFAARHPENTVSAFRDALAAGADGVELDVRAAADGTPVVCHDATVDRTTDGSGAVADHSPAELAALSVPGSDEGVPTLAAVLDALPQTTVYAELKEVGVAAAAADLLAATDHAVVVSSFDAAALAGLPKHGLSTAGRASEPRLATALLAASDGPDAVERAADLGCAMVHLHASVCDERTVAAAHDRGLAVAAWTLAPPGTDGDEWTVTDPDIHDHLRTVGVDALIADAPPETV